MQLAVDLLEALGRVALRGVDHMDEQSRAFQMREELVAETGALACSFDQAGNVCDDELSLVRARPSREPAGSS